MSGKLQQLGPAAVEPILRGLAAPQTVEAALGALHDAPAGAVVEPLVHLLGTPPFSDHARQMLLRLPEPLLLEALQALLCELAIDAHGFAAARRRLDLLWPDIKPHLVQIAGGTSSARKQALRYLASREPLSQEAEVRSRFPVWEAIRQELPRFQTPAALAEWLVRRSGFWSPTEYSDRGDISSNMWRRYGSDVTLACLACLEKAPAIANAVLRAVAGVQDLAGDLVHALAIPELTGPALSYLENTWKEKPRSFLSVWKSSLQSKDAVLPGLLEHFFTTRLDAWFKKLVAWLDEPQTRSNASLFLASRGQEAIPHLAGMAGKAGYTKGVADAVEPMLAEVVAAALGNPPLRAAALACLRSLEFARAPFTAFLQEIIAQPGFDPNDWLAGVRKHTAALADFPMTLSLPQAICIGARWEASAYPERRSLIQSIQGKAMVVLKVHASECAKEMADTFLTSQHVVVGPRQRWFVAGPAAAANVALQLTPELSQQLYHMKYFFRYLCQTRLCGPLKCFASDLLEAIP